MKYQIGLTYELYLLSIPYDYLPWLIGHDNFGCRLLICFALSIHLWEIHIIIWNYAQYLLARHVNISIISQFLEGRAFFYSKPNLISQAKLLNKMFSVILLSPGNNKHYFFSQKKKSKQISAIDDTLSKNSVQAQVSLPENGNCANLLNRRYSHSLPSLPPSQEFSKIIY